LWGGPEFFKGVIFVGLRNGILFVCPAEERLVSVNQMFNEAGFYAKENPDMSDWRQSRRGEIYLLSQHFKEVFVVAVTEDALYYKVYPTSGDSFRAYTIDLKQFVRVPSLKLHLDGSPLLSMDLFDNLLYAFYKDQVWSVPIGREHYDEPKKV
uniref:DPPIV_N domain-containing protein n=1 Tax=Toxocara canis TaxID=6265 RepID=A0A183U207_TOXCA